MILAERTVPEYEYNNRNRLAKVIREELRTHVHVTCPDGEAKFWIEPAVALADFVGLSNKQLSELQKLVEEHRDEIGKAWKKHFGS